jgi:hypothetical protein
MAILQQSVLEYCRAQLSQHYPQYANYPYIAPQEAVYPFLTVSALSSTTSFTFGKNLEFIRVQISIFDNNSSAQLSTELMDGITNLFHRANIVIPGKGCSIKLVCTHKDNEFQEFQQKEHYYMSVVSFIFTAEKILGCAP